MLAQMLAKTCWGERRSRRARCAQTVMSKVEVASIQRPWKTTWIFGAGPVWLIGLKQQPSIRSWCLSKWQTLMENVYLRRFVRTCLIECTQRVPRNSSFFKRVVVRPAWLVKRCAWRVMRRHQYDESCWSHASKVVQDWYLQQSLAWREHDDWRTSLPWREHDDWRTVEVQNPAPLTT